MKKPADFFPDPKPSTIIDEARKQMEAETGLIDPDVLRRLQDWSYLSGKVVGAEHDVS